MPFTSLYITPPSFDNLLLASDGDLLTGLHFIDSQKAEEHLWEGEKVDLPIFRETRRWLDIYFSGHQPDFTPRYKLENVTPFRQEVSEIMCTIPFGGTMTYDSHADSAKARDGEDVGAGGGRCGRVEPHLPNHSLPPCDGCRRSTHGLWRRNQ